MADATGGGGPDPKKQINDLKESVEILKDSFVSLGQIIKNEIGGNIRDADRATRDYGKSVASSIQSTLKSLGKNSQEILSNTLAMGDGTLKLNDVLKQINKTRLTELKTQIDIKNAYKANVISLTNMRKYTGELNAKTKEQIALLAQQGLEAYRIEETMGKMGKIFKDLTKVPLLGSLIDADKIVQSMQRAAAEGAGRWKTFGVGIKETFASIGRSLTDPFILVGGIVSGFVKLVKLAAEYQSKQFEAAKDLGVSVERGKQLRDNFVSIARSNLNLAVTADQLQKSYTDIQNELGVIVKQSEEFNITSTLIERRTGATAESMAQLQFAAKASNVSLMRAYQSIIGAAKETGARVKLEMSEKQILDGIAKTSAIIYLNFNGNFKAIAKANVEAKSLGTTLDKINATQDQFLDFESSIAKQFEAEVLTGKELNLTRARYLALTHDTEGLMREITGLIGTAAEFNKMDTLTQQAKAEALGLSREAVAQMYMDQQKTLLLGEAAGADLQTQYETLKKMHISNTEIEQTLGREAMLSAQQASVTEKMASALDSVKKSIAEASTRLLPMVEGMLNFLTNTEKLKNTFVGISAILGGIVGFSIAMKAAGIAQVQSQIQLLQLLAAQNVQLQMAAVRQGLLTEQQIVGAGAAVTAGSSYLGPAAIAIGIAAITALMAYLGTRAMSAPSIPSVGIPEVGMTPINPVTTSATVTGTETKYKPPVINFKATTYVGTENWSKTTQTAVTQDTTLR